MLVQIVFSHSITVGNELPPTRGFSLNTKLPSQLPRSFLHQAGTEVLTQQASGYHSLKHRL